MGILDDEDEYTGRMNADAAAGLFDDDRPSHGQRKTHNIEPNVAADQLRLLIERVERLEEEKKGIMDDVKDVFLEAKSVGYDVKIMRQVLKIRKMDKNDRAEQQAILDTYLSALGLD